MFVQGSLVAVCRRQHGSTAAGGLPFFEAEAVQITTIYNRTIYCARKIEVNFQVSEATRETYFSCGVWFQRFVDMCGPCTW